MKGTARVLGLLAAAWLLSACAQSQTEQWHGDRTWPATKGELYRQIGVPAAVLKKAGITTVSGAVS